MPKRIGVDSWTYRFQQMIMTGTLEVTKQEWDQLKEKFPLVENSMGWHRLDGIKVIVLKCEHEWRQWDPLGDNKCCKCGVSIEGKYSPKEVTL